ncbi:MAG: hypothetical protein NVS1B13_09930 [Flavisolibacter sp.]
MRTHFFLITTLLFNLNSFFNPCVNNYYPHETYRSRILYGIASYYADKFDGRETTNGEIYDHTKLSAACNVLPLGTWIRVTNLSNNKSVVVHTNDRLNIRIKRLVDMSRAAAEILGYTRKGLTRVKVEILSKE